MSHQKFVDKLILQFDREIQDINWAIAVRKKIVKDKFSLISKKPREDCDRIAAAWSFFNDQQLIEAKKHFEALLEDALTEIDINQIL